MTDAEFLYKKVNRKLYVWMVTLPMNVS